VKTLPAGLAASLATGVTTLCWCWKLTRMDNSVLGFTDHDNDLVFDSVAYRAESGLTASAWAATAGLAVDTIDAHGALQSASLTEDDLARGLWDGAKIEVWRVDWSDTDNRVLMFTGSIGEVERGEMAFRAELRSLAHGLNQPKGRIFSALCNADIGDAKCSVNLSSSAFSASASVLGVLEARASFKTSGLAAFDEHWFSRGLLTWSSGANNSARMEVKRHTISGSDAVIELVQDMPFDIAANDQFSLSAGCDKDIATCKAKFDNVLNFRGFPHMPGNDWVTTYPNRDDGNDGGALG
jgi:uncharacterized phage protein (TIGR02218 family)